MKVLAMIITELEITTGINDNHSGNQLASSFERCIGFIFIF